jgi:lysine-ketoglutarate reductase/saccharopine dehydrogenase-like protein (TIGR00300 family)
MEFKLPAYRPPNFKDQVFLEAPNVTLEEVVIKGVAPSGYHAMSIYPEYFKVDGKWLLAHESRMDCVAVYKACKIEVIEFRNLCIGDQVVVGRTEDASEGIYVYPNGFKQIGEEQKEVFAFRTGRSRETSYSKDYDELYELLKYERANNGYIVWVLGPAVSFDQDARLAVSSLVEKGYVNALLAGNALATHDLEGGYLGTALGQDIYTGKSSPNGHYHHLDLLNKVREHGSINQFMEKENITNGIIHACVKHQVPYVLAGSIRDDGPLPEVFGNVYEAQDEMRKHTRKCTTLICLATQLHTIASGNMTPSYTVKDGKVRNVFIYSVDISEFVVNKLRDRGTLEVNTIVTNVQDFVVQLDKNL